MIAFKQTRHLGIWNHSIVQQQQIGLDRLCLSVTFKGHRRNSVRSVCPQVSYGMIKGNTAFKNLRPHLQPLQKIFGGMHGKRQPACGSQIIPKSAGIQNGSDVYTAFRQMTRN